MASRGVHLESANSLSASSFINVLRRFQSRRGPVRQLRSDQGTTFVGARSGLREVLAEMEQDRVHQYLLENNCDWIPFKQNTPHASHMGETNWHGAPNIRGSSSQYRNTIQLDDESFRTFMTEVEGIINSQPLTTDYLCSADAPEPLTPSHLLTMKPKVVLPPPGKFQKEDIYAHKWWRRVQYLTNEFWVRWRKEFLHQLQERKKWVHPERDLQVGDVVISKEGEQTRNQWPFGRVMETHPSNDRRVRSFFFQAEDGIRDNLGRRQYSPSLLDRPVHKLVLLVPATETQIETQETREVPTEEPKLETLPEKTTTDDKLFT
ncbi:uncharacterized protein LOC110990629 [Acanthaster planci]|uniref:Uncharacterized protein LOC110990629 n=1 Tax=Acanthaster planci TaxID=133434 RepID=A0A8B8A0X1_ACAPL|nr:uncharacterized protein LOC110990629 [Acanthaster planci]